MCILKDDDDDDDDDDDRIMLKQNKSLCSVLNAHYIRLWNYITNVEVIHLCNHRIQHVLI